MSMRIPPPPSYDERRQRDIDDRTGLKPITRGRRSFHRPDEVLVQLWAEPLLSGFLVSDHGAIRYQGTDTSSWRNLLGSPEEQGDLNTRLEAVGTALWSLPPNSDVDRIVDDLRSRLLEVIEEPDTRRLPDDRSIASAVGPNYVYWGEPVYQGGPAGPPFPVQPLTLAADAPAANAPVDLAILDTGLPADFGTLHPILKAFRPDPDDIDALSRPNELDLATLAGHGLFIGGLVHRVAPMVAIDPGKVLGQTGDTDDTQLSLELNETTAPVINLSLGAYTGDDQPPPGLQPVIDRLLAQGRVVVASAGNNRSDRPFWPAAMKGVIAVAAFNSTGPLPNTTEFSSFGAWVDVCAPGDKVLSTYVEGSIPAVGGPVTFSRWAGWSGTSFAAPVVAAEIARRVSNPADQRSAKQVAMEFLSELDAAPFPGYGGIYHPPVDLTR